jgi:hypothetical protein
VTTDRGGDFSNTKIVSFINYGGMVDSITANSWRYTGEQFPADPQAYIDSILNYTIKPASDATLMALGTKAIAKCIPTNPVVDGATFLGELKAGLPKAIGKELFKTKFKDYRKIGDEYLNVEFGWKPLVSDLQSAVGAVMESDKILKQLHRDSGKNVRRRFEFPEEIVNYENRTSGQYAWIPPGGGLDSYLYDGSGTRIVNTQVTTKTWFSGCFTYHLNLGTTLQDRIDRNAAEARKLYGLELTPATAWNLAPWSWLADWNGNIGDVLHNVSRFSQDGLVMRYGYIMQEITAKCDISLVGGGHFKPANSSYALDAKKRGLHMTIIGKSKVRRRATPFGFGLDMSALTGRQLAILGALGISRVR